MPAKKNQPGKEPGKEKKQQGPAAQQSEKQENQGRQGATAFNQSLFTYHRDQGWIPTIKDKKRRKK